MIEALHEIRFIPNASVAYDAVRSAISVDETVISVDNAEQHHTEVAVVVSEAGSGVRRPLNRHVFAIDGT